MPKTLLPFLGTGGRMRVTGVIKGGNVEKKNCFHSNFMLMILAMRSREESRGLGDGTSYTSL